MARASVFHARRPRRLWIIPATFIVSIAVTYVVVTNPDTRPSARIGVSLVVVLAGWVIALIAAVLLWTLVYVTTLRNVMTTAFAGAVLLTRFEDDSFVSSNPLFVSRYSYAATRCVVVHRGFVFVRLWGNTSSKIFPEELIPADVRWRLQPSPDPGKRDRG